MSANHDQRERGAVLVEAPLAIIIIFLLTMGITTLVQVAFTHLALSSAVRTTTRYATHVDYDPANVTDPAARHRTEQQVKEWAAEVAAEADVQVADVTVSGRHLPSGTAAPITALVAGDEITITVTKTVNNALYRLAASVTNGVGHVFGADDVFNPDGVGIKAAASTYVE